MDPSYIASKVSKNQFPSAEQSGSSLLETQPHNSVLNSVEDNKKPFADLLDMGTMVNEKGEDSGIGLTSSLLPGLKACTRNEALSASMKLPTLPFPTPGRHNEYFPVTYCCCGSYGSHGSAHYGNHPCSSSTIDPVRLSYKETVGPPYPLTEASSFPVCDGTDNLLPLALRQPLTNALHHNNQRSKLLMKRGSHRKSSPVPPETAVHGHTLAGHGRSRRSKASYDPKTSFLLNTLFFESFGNDRKPTKTERRKIQRKTGISSRHLTYWLSNHKRRLKPELMAYRRLQQAGKIDCYEEFTEYCKSHHVPEISLYRMENLDDMEGDSSSLSSDREGAGDADVDTDNE